MISRFMRRPFKLIKTLVDKQSMNDKTMNSMAAVGLGLLLTQMSQGKKSSNIVVKPALRLRIKPTVIKVAGCVSRPDQQHSCFLKACHLCNKGLSLDKEVYMYRGDIGFCSIVCRDRQIVLDELRDLEASTKKVLAAYRRRTCTSKVLDDVHLQQERIPSRRTLFAL
ncbi:FCS-Like Zinc finger 17-like [Argentina anserina]|uniref:FCS-Like Zinc finger 17-like n=1 Tax=Argentina anserina TaxID=57926 RepID=UPI00217657F2|nr:FCS-Like Zinc finger 17-like [Potentilla anserina]